MRLRPCWNLAVPIEMRHEFTRQLLRDNPKALFVFGDNMVRAGFGGQAKECRGEPNAVGLPTKKAPSMDEGAFFLDADLPDVKRETTADLKRVAGHVKGGGTLFWPAYGIGTGRAQLKERAPAIADWYNRCFMRLLELDVIAESSKVGAQKERTS